VVKALGAEVYLHERYVGGVHGLDGEFIFGTVNVGVLDEVFECFNELFEYFSLGESCFEHD